MLRASVGVTQVTSHEQSQIPSITIDYHDFLRATLQLRDYHDVYARRYRVFVDI
jgi:hypothetical protein